MYILNSLSGAEKYPLNRLMRISLHVSPLVLGHPSATLRNHWKWLCCNWCHLCSHWVRI